jgi:hypothetical protein
LLYRVTETTVGVEAAATVVLKTVAAVEALMG